MWCRVHAYGKRIVKLVVLTEYKSSTRAFHKCPLISVLIDVGSKYKGLLSACKGRVLSWVLHEVEVL